MLVKQEASFPNHHSDLVTRLAKEKLKKKAKLRETPSTTRGDKIMHLVGPASQELMTNLKRKVRTSAQ